MSFELDGIKKVFNSWLHQRPAFTDGTWSQIVCVLRANHPTETTFYFKLSTHLNSKNALELNDRNS